MQSSRSDVLKCVQAAVGCVKNEFPSLLGLGVHEQALSSRIAVYLQRHAKLFVDCEYNKHVDQTKRIRIEEARYANCECSGCKKNPPPKVGEKSKRFRPDVIVHLRKDKSHNLVAIEIKKHDFCLFDEAKLMALTDPGELFKYKLGIAICFPEGIPKYRLYADGARIDM